MFRRKIKIKVIDDDHTPLFDERLNCDEKSLRKFVKKLRGKIL